MEQRQTTWRPVFSFADMQQKEAQLLQQNHVMHCQLKSCQLLHNCKKNHILKGLQQVDDFEGRSQSSEVPLF